MKLWRYASEPGWGTASRLALDDYFKAVCIIFVIMKG